MSFACRPATPSDVPVVALLGAHSFPAVGRTLAQWEDVLLDPAAGGVDSLWLAEEGGRMIGACRLFSYEQWIGGISIPIMGLGMVAVSPAARRRGVAARLVASAMDEARRRGDVASLLYPFRTEFYSKLGYGLAGEAHQYVLPPTAFPGDREGAGVETADNDIARKTIASIYDRWIAGQTGQLARPAHAWDRVWQGESRFGTLFFGGDGSPEGYAVHRYVVGGSGPATVEVEEYAWLSGAARKAMFGWLVSLGDQWDRIVLRSHPDDLLGEYLREHRHPMIDAPRWHYWFPAMTTLQGPMFRILDIDRAWAARSLNEGKALTVALSVRDPHLPDNEGWRTLRLANSGVSVSSGRDEAADLTVEVDVQTLSRIYIGALTPSRAMAIGRMVVDRPNLLSRLDRLVEVPRPWTFDRF